MASISVFAQNDGAMQVECGTWLEMSATPFKDYHFVQWEDGDTNAVRRVEIIDDADFIAYFAANCEDYANLPIVTYYDWLLMLDVRAVHEMGYIFEENDVKWYRVVDEPDDMHNFFPMDDEFVCDGYYLTLDKNLNGSGDYYAVVDVSKSPSDMLCNGLMRTLIVNYSSYSTLAPHVSLMPTYAYAGEEITILGLLPNEETTIHVIDMSGKLVETKVVTGNEICVLNAVGVSGCYNVIIKSATISKTLRYIVQSK